jgi:hypothetical protein
MKLFNMASLKFGEQGGTNMQSMETANVYSIGSTKRRRQHPRALMNF